MVWFFARGQSQVRLETRYDNASREYVLEVAWPDRPSETERFGDLEAFRARVVILEEQLAAEHWAQVGSPEILPHGWRGPISN